MVHGGEIFGKMRNNIISDIFILDNSASKWWKVNIPGSYDALVRMGHTLAWIESRVYVIGGTEAQRGQASNSIIQLEFDF